MTESLRDLPDYSGPFDPDFRYEDLSKEALVRLTHGRTTLIVAHRFSTIRHAHRIVVLQQGKIAEQGTHAELLARPGIFHQLAQLQTASVR